MENQTNAVENKTSFWEKIKEFYYKNQKIFSPKFFLGAGLILFILIFVTYVSIVKVSNAEKSGVIALETGYLKLAKDNDSATLVDKNTETYDIDFTMSVNDIRVNEVILELNSSKYSYYYVYVDYTAVTRSEETISGIYLCKIYKLGKTLEVEFVVSLHEGETATSNKSNVKEIVETDGNSEIKDVSDYNVLDSYSFSTLKSEMQEKASKVNRKKVLSYTEWGFKARDNRDANKNDNYSNWFVI